MPLESPRTFPSPEADILLSTYNGAAFLPELLGSLEVQTFKGFRLLMRDDSSTDDSLQILSSFAKKAPFECLLLPSSGRLGTIESFNSLAAASTAPFIMLCDQDDVWLPQKVERSISAIKSFMERRPQGAPALAHCDLRVTDASLIALSDSHWRAQSLDAQTRVSLPKTLMQNSVTGCASIFNRALAKAAFPVPQDAIMHDWFLAIAAAAFDGICPIPENLILYRQHRSNSMGATDFSDPFSLARLLMKKSKTPRLGIDRPFIQAQAALHSIRGLTPESKAILERFASIPRLGWIERRRALLSGGFLKSGILRNLGLLALI